VVPCPSGNALGGCPRYVFRTLGGDWLLIRLLETARQLLAMVSIKLGIRITRVCPCENVRM
jgi:hypothetical protein